MIDQLSEQFEVSQPTRQPLRLHTYTTVALSTWPNGAANRFQLNHSKAAGLELLYGAGRAVFR